jgi:hypothetical protein
MSAEPDRATSADGAGGRPRSRTRDFWQLDVPLVLVLILCTVLTIHQFGRATEGVWRSWVYFIEWPLIGAFSVWIWWRFKHEAGGGFARRWRERAARFQQESVGPPSVGPDAPAAPADAQAVAAAHAAQAEEADPQLRAWREYQRELRRRDEDVHGPAGA